MSVAKQLYQLQEIDLEIESGERALAQIASQLGESQAVVRTQTKLKLEQQRFEELERQQHSAEWEIDDLVNKLSTTQERLYSGQIKDSKELSNLQHEINGLRARRNQLEDTALEIMDRVELSTASAAKLSNELKTLEAEWHSQQQQLSTDMEQIKTTLSDLERKRQLLSAENDPQTVEFYQEIKKRKGQAVAKVEQGICHGCRISLPTTDLQRARGDSLVQCSSCGRILFLP
ncbi:zinc ribbon domain-containing protein [Chloroflexota bacterium]